MYPMAILLFIQLPSCIHWLWISRMSVSVKMAAAQHVFAVPTFLRQWHERNGGGGDVRVLEVTMRNADGADANAVYFPMG